MPRRPALRAVIDQVGTAWPFTDAAVDISPGCPGVYFLYKDGQLIYIGAAINGSAIRSELESHRRGAHGACTQAATAFLFGLAADPLTAYKQCIERYRAEHAGRLPAGNEAGLRAKER